MNRTRFIVFAALILFVCVVKADVPRPTEYPASFKESDFQTKPWLREFEYVVVVNKATTGSDSQSARVYRNGQIVTAAQVAGYEAEVNAGEKDSKKQKERAGRIAELAKLVHNPEGTSFKVSTGRDAFEKKGEHHAQRDSWTVTPTGYYVPTSLEIRHKSETYSSSMCEGWAARLVGALLRKQVCTYMEYAVFFNAGIALHKAIPGTEPVLGKKASGGCVRLPAALAEFLFLNIGLTSDQAGKSPLVNHDGTLVVDAAGNPVYEQKTSKGVRRNKWSALVIVKSESDTDSTRAEF